MSNEGFDDRLTETLAPKRLKFFTHQILSALAKASPIWGFPAVIAGDSYPFVNQRTAQVPTIFLDIEAPDVGDHGMRILGTLLTAAIRVHSDKEDDMAPLGFQLLTMNNGHGRYSLVVQALNAKDPYDLVSLLSQGRYWILNSAFEIIDHLYEGMPQELPVVYQ